MTEPTPAMRRLAEIDARAAACDDPLLRSDVVCLVRLLSNLLAMHSPTEDGSRCAECAPVRVVRLKRRERPPTPCRTRWLLEVVLGRP
jgi:hypothetical protein